MAYKTYTTDAVVVGSEDRLTADKTIVLLTRDAGLVYARALGVRKERSKLRYGLQDFSCVRVSLVRGKQGWRVIGAERAHNIYFSVHERAARAALLRIVKLLRRLVRGEEAHPYLYDVVADGLSELAACACSDDYFLTERLLIIRVLAALGYVAPRPRYAEALAAPTLRAARHVLKVDPHATPAIEQAIEYALSASQL